jgi:hypothetical protein
MFGSSAIEASIVSVFEQPVVSHSHLGGWPLLLSSSTI